jgi:hypothetical protein
MVLAGTFRGRGNFRIDAGKLLQSRFVGRSRNRGVMRRRLSDVESPAMTPKAPESPALFFQEGDRGRDERRPFGDVNGPRSQ